MSEALVRIDPRSATAEPATHYLVFTLGGAPFAIPVAAVREVVEFHGLTRIPLAPEVLPGVMNLRGTVVPVIELAVRIGRPPITRSRRSCVIVVEARVGSGCPVVGCLVDTVQQAVECSGDDVQTRPAFGTGLRSNFVAAMVRVGSRFVPVLELEQVLAASELEQLVSAAAAPASRARHIEAP